MPDVFYAGKLSLPMKPLAYVNSFASWIAGNAQDGDKLKYDVKTAYNNEISDDLSRYDELATYHYVEIAEELLSGIDVKGKSVLDVSCGTGILSLLAMDAGASNVTCTDVSSFMLEKCRDKFANSVYGTEKADFSECDAEEIGFPDEDFDVVISSMVLGHVPDPQKAVSEMARVLRKGGMLAFSAQGTAHYWETADATYKAIAFTPSLWSACIVNRVAFWPREEKDYHHMLASTGLTDLRTKRKVWQDRFDNPQDALDFTLATSGALPLTIIPEKSRAKRDKFSEVCQRSFLRHDVKNITQDVVFAYGRK